MIVRPTLYSAPGGDTTQIDMTAKYLRKLGINVDIQLSGAKFDHHQYDLIHFFNIIRPDDILPNISATTPYVVSTIFVDYSEYDQKVRGGKASFVFNLMSAGRIEYTKALARWIFNGDQIKSKYYLFFGHKKSIQKIAGGAKILLPNSNSENNRLKKYLNQDLPFKKVVNAIDIATFHDGIHSNLEYEDHVICVGRIEGLKNQLNLIKALGGTKVQLTLIGKAAPNHQAYYDACKREASQFTNIHFLEHTNPDGLAAIYKAAKVHVLPSWFETTGLSSLEAGVMGCNLVVTKKGDTEEYFKDMVNYCQPDDIESIRNAVLEAYQKPVDPLLKDYILKHYNWFQAAEQTLSAYKLILEAN